MKYTQTLSLALGVALSLALGVALGCGAPSVGPTSAEPSPPPATRSLTSSIPQPSLQPSPLVAAYPSAFIDISKTTPKWLNNVAHKGASLAQRVQMLGENLNVLGQMKNGSEGLAATFGMISGLVGVELLLGNTPCDGACLDVRIAAYRRLRSWDVLYKLNITNELVQPALAMIEVGLDPGRVDAFKAYLRFVFSSSEQNWSRLVVDRIRIKATHSETRYRLLRQLAQHQQEKGRLSNALGLYKLALPLAPTDEGPATVLYELSGSCYHNLSFDCGLHYFKQANSAQHQPPSELQIEAKQGASDTREAAEGVRRTTAATTSSDLLARAGFLRQLSRYAESKKIYESLRELHPTDARPIVGLAELLIDEGFQMGAARTLLLQASTFEHREVPYYELRLGTWFEEFKLAGKRAAGARPLWSSMSKQLEVLAQTLQSYAVLAPDRGQALLLGAQIARVYLQSKIQGQGRTKGKAGAGDRELRAALKAVIPEVAASIGRVPKAVFLRRLQLVLARFDANEKRAIAAAARPVERGELAALQSNVQLALALVRNDGLAELEAQLKGRPARPAREALLALQATRATQNHNEILWATIEHELRSILLDATLDNASRSRLLNNLAVARFRQGDTEEALSLLAVVVQHQEKASPANVNAMALLPGTRPEQFDSLIAADLPKSAVFQARLWKLRKIKKRVPRSGEIKALAALEVDKGIGKRLRGLGGVLLEHSFEVGFGYSAKKRLIVQLDLHVLPWFVISATEAPRSDVVSRHRVP